MNPQIGRCIRWRLVDNSTVKTESNQTFNYQTMLIQFQVVLTQLQLMEETGERSVIVYIPKCQ